MSINNPPLKWQERKGWNALGGEEREWSGLLFSPLPFKFQVLCIHNAKLCLDCTSGCKLWERGVRDMAGWPQT